MFSDVAALPVFFVLHSTRVENDITTTTQIKLPSSYTCKLTKAPFDVLLLNAKKPFPYLVARVEAAREVYFADGLHTYWKVKGSYFSYSAVTFYAFTESTKTTRVFREVFHCNNGHELKRGRETLDAFDPNNHLFRVERIKELLRTKKSG